MHYIQNYKLQVSHLKVISHTLISQMLHALYITHFVTTTSTKPKYQTTLLQSFYCCGEPIRPVEVVLTVQMCYNSMYKSLQQTTQQ